jgi:hypothetical protein
MPTYVDYGGRVISTIAGWFVVIADSFRRVAGDNEEFSHRSRVRRADRIFGSAIEHLIEHISLSRHYSLAKEVTVWM